MTVSSTADLNAALRSAQAGETIQLAAGTYSGVVILGLNFGTPLTITSADSARAAVLVGLKVANSSGLTFSRLELTSVGSTDPYYAFRVQDSRNLIFTGLDVHGDLAAAPASQLWGFYVIGSTDVTFTRSRFHAMWAAITANKDTGVTIANNAFSQLDKGGVEMGGSSLAKITDNTFTDFHVGRGTHPDAIQIYTAGTTTVAHDIAITGNLYYRGAGDAAQGIFVQDEVGTLPFHNLTIADNAIIGGMWDSIYVKHVTGQLEIKGNVAASWAGLDMEGAGTPAEAKAMTPPVTTNFLAFIWLRGDLSGATVTETGNRAQVYRDDASGSGALPMPSGNAVLGAIRDRGAALLRAWESAHPAGARLRSSGQGAVRLTPS